MRYTSIKRAMCSLVVLAALHLQSHLAFAERSSLRDRKQLQRTDTIISNNLNEPILPMKVDDTKNDHYIITTTNTSSENMKNLRTTKQKRKDEYSFVPSHRKLQKPDYTYDCLADWTSIKSAIILSSVLSPDDPPDFVLCPDTVILLQIDETTQMEPVDIKIDNAKFRCGEKGKQEDKCLIVGGYAHFRLIGNVKGVTFQGITFSGSSMASILATGESNANAEFQDCAWIDNKGLTAVLIYNEDKGVPVDLLATIQDLVEPREKSMTLTFRDCVFSRNKNKYSTVLNLAGEANFVSTVFVSNQSRGGSIRIKFSSKLNMVKACFFENKAERAGIVVVEEKSVIEVNKDTYGQANSAEVGICSKIFYEVGDSCIDNEDEISCVGMCGFFTADTCDVDLERVASVSDVIKSILDNTYDGSGNGGGGNFLGKLSLELLIAGGVGFVIFVFFLVCCTGRYCHRSGIKKGKADYQLLQSHDNNQGPGGPSDSCGTSAPSEQPVTNIPVATPASQDVFEDNGIVASAVTQVDNDSTVAISQDKKEKKSEEGKPKPSITSPPSSAPVNRQSTNVKKASEDFLPTFKRSKRRLMQNVEDDDDTELGVLGKKVKKKSDRDSEISSKCDSDGKEKSERKVRIKDQETSSGEESDSDESKDEKNSKKKKSRKSLRKSRRHSTDEEATDDNEEHRKSRRHASDDEDAVKKSKSSLRKSRKHASDDEDAVKMSKDELRKSRRRASDDEEAIDDNEEHRKSRRHASDDEDAVKKSKSSLRKSRKHASDDEDAVKKSKDEIRKSRRHASDDEDATKKGKDELRKSRRHASDDEDAVKKSKDKLGKIRRRASDDEEATDDNEEHRKSRRHVSDDEDAVKMGKESLRKSRRRAKDGEDDDRKKSKEKDSSKKDLGDNDYIDKRKKLEKRSSVTRLSSDDDQKQNVKTPKTGETSKRKLDRSESSSKLNRSESSRKLNRSDSTSKLKRTVSDRKIDRLQSSSKLEKSDVEAKKSHKLERQLSRSSSEMNVDTSASGSENSKLPKRTSRRYSRRLSSSDLFTDDDESDAVSLSSGSSAWQSSIEGSIHRSTSFNDMEGEAKAANRRSSLASNRSQSFSIPNRKNLIDKVSVDRRRKSMDFSIASSMDESMGRRDSLEHKSTPKNRRDSITYTQYDSKKKLNEEEKAQIQKRTRTRSVTPIKSRSKDGTSSPSSDEKKESSSRSKRASTERKREKSSTSEPRSKRSSTEKNRDRSESPVPPKKSSRNKRSDSSKEKSRKSSTGRDSKSHDRSKSPPSKSKKESKTHTRERDGSKSKKSENGGDSRKRSGLSSSMPEKKSSDSKPSANIRSSMPVSSSNRRETMKESRRASTTSMPVSSSNRRETMKESRRASTTSITEEEESKKTSSKITKEKLLEDLNKMPKQKTDRFTNRKKIEQKGPRNMSKLAAFSLRDLKKSTKK